MIGVKKTSKTLPSALSSVAIILVIIFVVFFIHKRLIADGTTHASKTTTQTISTSLMIKNPTWSAKVTD